MAAPADGICDPRFIAVRDAFADNFAQREEVGAAVCITVEGRVVVDLWGGCADEARSRPWRADTLVNAFSIGKGLLALVVARLVGDGVIDVDDRVVTHWPEFAAHDKGATTLRHLLTHQAGLPACQERLPPDVMFDWSAMTAALAAEPPWWDPGQQHGYHVNTFGFLVGEVLRRITGRTPGALLRELIAEPLGADVHLGLPATEDARTADFLWPGDAPKEVAPALEGLDLMRHNAYFNPSGLSGAGVINTRAWRGAEMPSTNTHASARGVARVYTALVAGGTLDGVMVVDASALREATVEQVTGRDLVLETPTRFGLGFQLTQPERALGPNPGAFGHFGAGGSVGFCDPASGLAFGYVMNQLGPRWQNPRNRALIDAAFASL